MDTQEQINQNNKEILEASLKAEKEITILRQRINCRELALNRAVNITGSSGIPVKQVLESADEIYQWLIQDTLELDNNIIK